MRACYVYRCDVVAGILAEDDEGRFSYTYDLAYLLDPNLPPVSLTLPKRSPPYQSPQLFPCFVALLAEGGLADEQCRKLRLDERDVFGRLLLTCRADCIGSLHVQPLDEQELALGEAGM